MPRATRNLIGLVILLASSPQAVQAQGPPQPTKEHKFLQKEVGVWDAEVKMGDMTSKGVETNRMMGDLWLVSEFKGDFAGAPFEGHGLMGYDPDKGKFLTVWADSMTPRPTVMEGTYDEKTKTLTSLADEIDPQTKEKVQSKYVTIYKDDDSRVFTLSMKPKGASDFQPFMEIRYKRRAK